VINIETINIDHIESFHRAMDAVARERKYLAVFECPPMEATRSFVESNIKTGVPHFVATHDGKVVGWCDITLNWRPAFSHCGYLGMGIMREFRGQGIGSQLLEQTIAKARSKNLQRVELEVFKSNVIAIRIYRKFGFVEEGVKVRGAKIDQRFENVVVMGLLL